MSEPQHLNDHHRDTVAKILQARTNHNVSWRDTISMLDDVGTVEERKDGRFKVTLGGETEIFNRPKGKDLDEQQVIDLRRMLTAAGYTVDPTRES